MASTLLKYVGLHTQKFKKGMGYSGMCLKARADLMVCQRMQKLSTKMGQMSE